MFRLFKLKPALTWGLFVLVCAAVPGASHVTADPRHVKHPDNTHASAISYSPFPIYFEPNVGQADPGIRYFSHTADYTLSINRSGAAMVLAPEISGKGYKRSSAA